MKIYGKLIARARKNSNGSPCGLMDRTLEIYEIKTGLKGVLFKSSEKGWKKKENVISCAIFKIEEGGMLHLIEYANTLVSLIHR